MPQRGPAAGALHILHDFHGSDVKRIESFQFFSRAIFFVFLTASASLVNALPKEKSTGFFLLELPLGDNLSNFT